MEADKIQKKKINKGKLKKTIKNVLCRPDPVFWPSVPENLEKVLQTLLGRYKIHIPEFKKPHWKELKSIPKEQRPRQEKLEKPNGLLFGISECKESISKTECSAVLIEASVNPKTIVQPILESCTNAKVPVICLSGLRKLCATYFGIPTSCLGVKQGSLIDLSDKIHELAKDKLPKLEVLQNTETIEVKMNETVQRDQLEKMEVQECLHLYRTNKKTRAFIPPSEETPVSNTQQFKGQDFIKLPGNSNPVAKKAFMRMMVKRVANNPDRRKKLVPN